MPKLLLKSTKYLKMKTWQVLKNRDNNTLGKVDLSKETMVFFRPSILDTH